MRPQLETGVSMTGLKCSSLVDYITTQLELKHDALPEYDIQEWEDLIDSSDMTPEHWAKIAREIQLNYANYTGFVVLHGTDTLAYTATALSFILEDLSKPVVVTGAMLPITHIHSDGKKNFTTSLLVAAFSGIQEVMVVFGSRILRGSRTTKINCDSMDAFDSPNCSMLGRIGIDVQVNADSLRPAATRAQKNSLTIVDKPLDAGSICIMKVTPSFNTFLLRHMAATEVRPMGVILELFGTGTGPIGSTKFIDAIEFAVKTGVIFVAVTQCIRGTCSLQTYANGVKLHDMGVIEGKDMTKEAALVKLAYLFSKGHTSLEEVRPLMESNMRGEFSEGLMAITGQGNMHPVAARRQSMEKPASSATTYSVALPNDEPQCLLDDLRLRPPIQLSDVSDGECLSETGITAARRTSTRALKTPESGRFYHNIDFVSGVTMMTIGCCRNQALNADEIYPFEPHQPPTHQQ